MDGGPTSAQIVIIHAGQVVMDQTVGVDTLKRAGGAKDGPLLEVKHLGRFEGKEGPKALAWTKGGIAHRLHQPLLWSVRARQQLIQRDGHQICGARNPVAQV
jgi:hypothetical protein